MRTLLCTSFALLILAAVSLLIWDHYHTEYMFQDLHRSPKVAALIKTKANLGLPIDANAFATAENQVPRVEPPSPLWFDISVMGAFFSGIVLASVFWSRKSAESSNEVGVILS